MNQKVKREEKEVVSIDSYALKKSTVSRFVTEVESFNQGQIVNCFCIQMSDYRVK